MNKKIIIGSLVGGVVAYLVGGLLWGFLFADFYKANVTHYYGLMIDPPNMVGIAIGNLLWSLMIALLFDRMVILDFVKGATWGALLFFLVMSGMDLFFWASMNLYPPNLLAVDVALNAVFGGIVGGVIALTMSKVK